LTIAAILADAGRAFAQVGAPAPACQVQPPVPSHTRTTPFAGAYSLIDESRSFHEIVGTIVVGDVDVSVFRLALSVLPRPPDRIVVVSDSEMSGIAGRVRELDGFVPQGSSVIYLRHESITLRAAESSGGPYVLMLAIVIWHEQAHADGCNEAEAREREVTLWREFVRNGRVESSLGLTYLAALRDRK
jgi:hypothetical protein